MKIYKNLHILIIISIMTVSGAMFTGCDGNGPDSFQTPPINDGYKLVFSDEFDNNSLDTSIWNYETGYGDGGWGNNEWQLYTNSENNVRVENGNLIISARTSGNNGVRDGSITSGRINTMEKKFIRYGKIQARIKIPYQLGLWPAFWMLGNNFSTVQWPKCGEIDIMESFAKDLSANQSQGMLHWQNKDNAHTYSVPFYDFKYPYPTIGTFSEPLHEDFHIYEIEWDKEKVIWKVDGIDFYWEYITDPSKSEFHGAFFIIFNLAVGGDLGGTVDENTFPLDSNNNPTPQNLYVDWVRVYQKELPPEKFVIISSDENIKSEVDITANTIGEWSTSTVINQNGMYEGRKCWELTSGTKTPDDSNWGTVLAFQDGINGNFSFYSRLDVSIATTGGYSAYKVTVVPPDDTGGTNKEFILQVDDSIVTWQDFSIEISGLDAIQQVAIAGVGGKIGVSKIYVTDFTLHEAISKTALSDAILTSTLLLNNTDDGQVSQTDATLYANAISTAQIIQNNDATQEQINNALEDLESATQTFKSSFVEKSFNLISSGIVSEPGQITVNALDTGTKIEEGVDYQGKKCLGLTSGDQGTALAIEGALTEDYSDYNKISVSIATSGDYTEYLARVYAKQTRRSTTEYVEFVLPVDTSNNDWQDVSVEIAGIKYIERIAIIGKGGVSGFSKIYISDFKIVKDTSETDAQDFIIISSDTNIQSNVVISDDTVGEWSTGTVIHNDALYEGKNCWELLSNGSWGTVLAFQNGINGDFSDYAKLNVSIATTGGFGEYKVAIVPSTGSNKEFVLSVNDSITSWQDISVDISGLDEISQIAIYGVGGNIGVSTIYVTDFKLVKGNGGTVSQKFVIISSDVNETSDVTFNDSTIGDWSTGTSSNGEASHEGKNCWEMTSGSKTPEEGNWGTVLVFQNGIDGDFSKFSCIKLKIATSGDFSPYKLLISAYGLTKEIVLPVNNSVSAWQDISIDIIDIPLNLKSIDFIAVLGVGGVIGSSKLYVTDFEIVKDTDITLAQIDDDYVFKSSDPGVISNLIEDGDNNSDLGNIIFGEWGTQTKLGNTTFAGSECWQLTAVAGWGAVLALQGDISDGTNIDNYDVDLSKYTNIKFKIASEGSFDRYALSIGSNNNGNEASQEVGFSLKDQTSWNEIDIDLDYYGVDLSNVSQIALFGVYPEGIAAGQKIYITDFMIYDTGIVGNEKPSSDDKFVFKSSTDEHVDIIVDGDDCAHNGNITINDWSTGTILGDTEYNGSNCWALTKTTGWGAVLALMGDIYGDVLTYDIDLTKYQTVNFKIAAVGTFTEYFIKFIAGPEFGIQLNLTEDWKDVSINLNEIPLNLLNLKQIAIYGAGGNAGDRIYITDLNISK
jgi:beta-glucanase (GH16 family)